MAAAEQEEKELLASVVAEIRAYAGSDPIRPWLRGVRKMEKALPPEKLREKLPRFLQKCAQEFQDDARYRDDPRYLRVWIQMMDYVDDAKPLLKKMEQRGIGLKRASFYMAYALYYEKHRRLESAEKMYQLGIQRLAEPIAELLKAHEQFMFRMEKYKRRREKLKERMPSKAGSNATSKQHTEGENINCTEHKPSTMQKSGSSSNASSNCYPPLGPAKVGMLSRGKSGGSTKLSRCNSDDTVVIRFVGSALDGKSETEDACHHGLVEPTINTKEAMDAINSMFLEPVEPGTMFKRRAKTENPNYNQKTNTLDIFVDEDESSGNYPNNAHKSTVKQGHQKFGPQTGTFEIFADEDGPCNNQNAGQNKNTDKDNVNVNQETGGFEIFMDECEANQNVQNAMCRRSRRPPRPLCNSSRQQSRSDFQGPFVGGFAILPDDESEQRENMKSNQETGGFEIFVDDEANGDVQNAIHRKSGMGHPRPLSDSSRQQGNSDFHKPFVGGFAILPDDEDEQCDIISRNVQPNQDKNSPLCEEQADFETRYHETSHPAISGLREDTVIHRFVGSTVVGEPTVENACHHGLVDPTVNLKEAMNDINSMFCKPLNFKGEKANNKKNNALSDRKEAPSGFSILADDDLNFKGEKANNRKNNTLSDRKEAPASGFSILADDDLEEKPTGKTNGSDSCKSDAENGLFEPTITTRDVMAEINDMFGMPLDF